MPTIHGVADAATAAAGTQITKTGVRGTIGNNYLTLAAVAATTAATGTAGEFEISVASTTGVVVNQRVTGTSNLHKVLVFLVSLVLPFISQRQTLVQFLVTQYSRQMSLRI